MRKIPYSLILLFTFTNLVYCETIDRSLFNSIKPLTQQAKAEPGIGVRESYNGNSVAATDPFVASNQIAAPRVSTPQAIPRVLPRQQKSGIVAYSEAYYQSIQKNVDLWVYNGYNEVVAAGYAALAAEQRKMFARDDENLFGPGLTELVFINGRLWINNGGDATRYKAALTYGNYSGNTNGFISNSSSDRIYPGYSGQVTYGNPSVGTNWPNNGFTSYSSSPVMQYYGGMNGYSNYSGGGNIFSGFSGSSGSSCGAGG